MVASRMPDPAATIRFGGFIVPERAVGDYAAVASFLVNGAPLLVTVSVTLAAVVESRVGHHIDWLDYPPLAALGYARIGEMLESGMTASEIPLTAEDAADLLEFDRAWHGQTEPDSPPQLGSGDPAPAT